MTEISLAWRWRCSPRRRPLSCLAAAGFGVLALLGGACRPGAEPALPDPSSAGARPAASPATSSSDAALPAPVRARLAAALADVVERYRVPGASVAVSTPEGSWRATVGVGDVDTGVPVSSGWSWPVRSLTKSIVVTALLRLVDEGSVGLDDPIGEYVENVPGGETITLRQLADMTSGVGDYTRSAAFLEAFLADPSRRFTLAELNAFGLAEGAEFAPGMDAAYSNTATNLLGVVLEKVTGEPLAAVVRARVTGPLGMADTVFPSSEDDWPEPHATGYQPGEDGEPEESFSNFSVMGASGAMISTRDDLEVWAEALGSGRLLSSELQAERLVGRPLSHGPEYDRYAVGIGEVTGWWGHTGEGLGFTALAMYEPESGATAVVLMNISQARGENEAGEVEARHVPTVLMRRIAAELAMGPADGR